MELYTDKFVMRAFKYSAKKRVGTARYEAREKKLFLRIWNIKMKQVGVSCVYDGFNKIKETSKDMWCLDYVWQ